MAAVPSPSQPAYSARSLLNKVAREGGRIFHMRERLVFVVTENEDLARWLLSEGALPYLPRNAAVPTDVRLRGAYRNAPGGPLKWDMYVHVIPVRGEQTIHEAAIARNSTLYVVGEDE